MATNNSKRAYPTIDVQLYRTHMIVYSWLMLGNNKCGAAEPTLTLSNYSHLRTLNLSGFEYTYAPTERYRQQRPHIHGLWFG